MSVNTTRCEIIHIGIVTVGNSHNIYFHTMLKSILFYRVNPLHLHIMTNKPTRIILEVLFYTWQLPQVNVSFYDITQSLDKVKWIPNYHYAGIYGLVKLTFPTILPDNITKIIVLDTDLTLLADIAELWAIFDKFQYNQVIGLVENESDFYLKKKNGWPALGRGFNTGVALLKIERLKYLNWSKLWSEVAKTYTATIGATSLGDQDVMNSFIKKYPNMLYQVPCYWNTQLSDNTFSYNCYRKYPVKIVHWNSPKKTNVENIDGEYFRNIYSIFLEMNGNRLRKQLHDCSNLPRRKITEEPTLICDNFNRGATTRWRTLLNFRSSEITVVDHDVTFLAQLSYDRLQMIEALCRHWEGPITVVLYLSDPELQLANNFIENSLILQERSNIAYHVVFKDGDFYPINMLRNVGLRTIVTPYVFLADIDFLPKLGLYDSLRQTIGELKPLIKKALVIPAFETLQYKGKFPRNKNELLQMMSKNTVFIFRYDVWAPAHAPTNYTKWKRATRPYTVKWQPDYEPYIVVKRDVVEYDNRFIGFGWNKVSHIMELESQNYEFIVLPNAFVIHKPHSPSYDIAKFRTSPNYRMCLQSLKENFIDMLHKKYDRTFNEVNITSNLL